MDAIRQWTRDPSTATVDCKSKSACTWDVRLIVEGNLAAHNVALNELIVNGGTARCSRVRVRTVRATELEYVHENYVHRNYVHRLARFPAHLTLQKSIVSSISSFGTADLTLNAVTVGKFGTFTGVIANKRDGSEKQSPPGFYTPVSSIFCYYFHVLID